MISRFFLAERRVVVRATVRAATAHEDADDAAAVVAAVEAALKQRCPDVRVRRVLRQRPAEAIYVELDPAAATAAKRQQERVVRALLELGASEVRAIEPFLSSSP